jgi:hypothetical protein
VALRTVPDEGNTVALGETRGCHARTDETVTTGGAADDFEALRLGGADHDHLVDSGMGLERVGGAHRRIAGHEEPDPHEGLTGFQSRSGSGSLDDRSNATAAATATTTRTRGE